MDYIDVFLLHNPEYYLTQAISGPGGDVAPAREEMLRRIYRVWACLSLLKPVSDETSWHGMKRDSERQSALSRGVEVTGLNEIDRT
jgi:hypothetical protein